MPEDDGSGTASTRSAAACTRRDGVSLIPMSAKLDLRKGSDAAILIFRRGSIDAALMDANPNLKLIQRIGARADAIDLAAAAQRGILVSCVPRATLQLTAEHAILLALALGKTVARGRRCRAQGPLGPRPRAAGSQRRLQLGRHREHRRAVRQDLRHHRARRGRRARRRHGARASARACSTAIATGCRPRRSKSSASNTPSFGRLLAESDFVSLHATNIPENRGLIGAETFAAMKKTRVLHQHRARTDRGRRRAPRCADKGTIAGAGLDVHTIEPRPVPDQPRDAAERDPDAAHCGRLAQGRNARRSMRS